MRKGILHEKKKIRRCKCTANWRAKDKAAPDIDALFGVRSYVSERSKQKREGPAAASWISLVSPHMPSVMAEA